MMGAHTRGRPVVVIGVTAVLVVLLVGVLVARLTRPGSEPALDARSDAGARADTQDVAPGTRLGPAAGAAPDDDPSRTEEGAAATAVAYTAASQRWLYLTDEQVAEAVEEIAALQAAERLVAEVVGEMRSARERLLDAPARVWWLVHPLAWRVESYGGGEARVAVWTVTVLSAAGVALPQSEWMTVTVDLVWADNGWRVEAVDDRPGPTPMPGPGDEPWDPDRFDAELAGFTRLGAEGGS